MQTDGDLREVVRTIVTSPEFFAAEARNAKVKTPLEFVVSAVRVTGLDVQRARPLVQALRDLGQPLYGAQPPTGYADTANAWVSSGALLNRMNFAVALTSGQLRTGRERGEASDDLEQTRRRLFATALAGDAGESTQRTVAKATTASQVAALTLGSPEFQKR
jgi:uncharacterized protein (DUF1800 family)